MKCYDSSEAPGSVFYRTMVWNTSAYSFSFSVKTVPLEFLVDVKSLQPYHNCPLTRTALDSSSNARLHSEVLSQKLPAQSDHLLIGPVWPYCVIGGDSL